jgi:hypothetical protein
MRILATIVLLAISGFATTANAESLLFADRGALGLEHAVRIDGMPCMMTTPYDKWARCGTIRRNILPCAEPEFVNNELICRRAAVFHFKRR